MWGIFQSHWNWWRNSPSSVEHLNSSHRPRCFEKQADNIMTKNSDTGDGPQKHGSNGGGLWVLGMKSNMAEVIELENFSA